MVQDYVASTNGRLELHFLPGYAPELNPDEFVWNHVKRTGTAKVRSPKATTCETGSRQTYWASRPTRDW